MKLLTVKNRCSEPFSGMYDAVEYIVPAEGQLTVLDYIAHHLKRQSVVRHNPVTGEADFRLAIVENGDDDSPLTEIPVEVLDRSDMDLRKVRIVHIGNRPPAPIHTVSAGSAITAKERS